MKKRRLLFPLLFSIVLTGCLVNNKTEDQIPVIGNEPSSGLPEKASENEIGKPLNLLVNAGSKTTGVLLDRYCWEETENTCTIEPKNPRELKLLKDIVPMRVKQGETITFAIEIKNQSLPSDLRRLDKVQVIQFGKFNEESSSEVIGNQITAPMEEGMYYFYVIASWDGDTKGKAAYAFSISVQ